MPVVGQPAATQLITRDDVRGFLRDVAGQIPDTGVLNTLLDNVEFSDTDIERAIRFTVARFNGMTPQTRMVAAQMNEWVLLVGTAAHLMKSEAFRQLRNQITAQDADIAPVGLDDKQGPYSNIAKMCDEEFLTMARGIKTQDNMEAAYGNLGSGYRLTSRFHHY
jgi:hypothetical protein